MNHTTRKMDQDELAAMEQNSRLMMFHPKKERGFHKAVQEYQRTARDAVNQDVLESSARCETALSLEYGAARHRIDHGDESETQAALRHQRAHMLTEHNQLRSGKKCPKKLHSASNGL